MNYHLIALLPGEINSSLARLALKTLLIRNLFSQLKLRPQSSCFESRGTLVRFSSLKTCQLIVLLVMTIKFHFSAHTLSILLWAASARQTTAPW